jgi:uncharacterized membrane protein YkvA (DUF1232 family)
MAKRKSDTEEPADRRVDELAAAVAEDYESGADWDEEEADRASEAALAGVGLPASSGLLSFYDRLRERIVRAVERRGGKLGPATVKALLLVPDVFILLVRIVLDPEVPGSARALVGGALAYFVLPLDLMPEAVLGGAGYLDDLVLAAAVLAHTFGGELEPYARRHWSGPEDIRVVLGDIAGAAQGLLGANLYERITKLLARRGVEVDETE